MGKYLINKYVETLIELKEKCPICNSNLKFVETKYFVGILCENCEIYITLPKNQLHRYIQSREVRFDKVIKTLLRYYYESIYYNTIE